jgi:GNAT superfamily N-acetyltransferase
LCNRGTNEHEEFNLLEAMNRRFIEDCRSGGEYIISRACNLELEVFFILAAPTDTVVGYAALLPSYEHGIEPGSAGLEPKASALAAALASPGPAPCLTQLYVEPDFRRKGMATSALRVLLARHSLMVVDAPSLGTARAMLALGFQPVGARLGVDSNPQVLYAWSMGAKDQENTAAPVGSAGSRDDGT